MKRFLITLTALVGFCFVAAPSFAQQALGPWWSDPIFLSDLTYVNAYFVGKHGDDANSGTSPARAKLTFGSAMTAASAGDVIVCSDAGRYTEDITGKAGVGIFAPNATLITATSGSAMADEVQWTFGWAEVQTGDIGFLLNSAGANAHLFLGHIEAAGTGVCFATVNGKLEAQAQHIEIANGFGVGSTTADELYVQFGEMDISGTGVAVAATSSGDVNIQGQCIEDSGSGTAFFSTAPSTTHIGAIVDKIEVGTLSNVSANTDLDIVVSHLEGTLAVSGAGKPNLSGPSVAKYVFKAIPDDTAPSPTGDDKARFTWPFDGLWYIADAEVKGYSATSGGATVWDISNGSSGVDALGANKLTIDAGTEDSRAAGTARSLNSAFTITVQEELQFDLNTIADTDFLGSEFYIELWKKGE